MRTKARTDLGDAHGRPVPRGDVAAEQGAAQVGVGRLLDVHHAVGGCREKGLFGPGRSASSGSLAPVAGMGKGKGLIQRLASLGIQECPSPPARVQWHRHARRDLWERITRPGLKAHPPMKAVLFWKVEPKSKSCASRSEITPP